MFWMCFAMIAIVCLLFPDQTSACPYCYQASDSPQTESVTLAIFVLLGVTGSVLGGIVAVFLYMRKRAKSFEVSKLLVTEQGEIVYSPENSTSKSEVL
jgi:hypothetical protein